MSVVKKPTAPAFWTRLQRWKIFSRLSPRRTPAFTTAVFGVVTAIMAALLPLSEIAKLVNIGTLFAFVLVAIGVIFLRRSRPDLKRPFRTPLVPLVPILSVLASVWLMLNLAATTWLRFGIWLVVGLFVYFGYSYRHSRLARGGDAREAEGGQAASEGQSQPRIPVAR